jgi:5-methylthioribose kinase
MAVRGAPALAIAAALSLAVELANGPGFDDAASAAAAITARASFLETARPTAVNLGEATRRLSATAAGAAADAPAGPAGGSAVVDAVIHAAEAMLADDVACNHAMAAAGADALVAAAVGRGLARPGEPLRVLTHCNTGALATAAHGTALGIISTLAARGHLSRAFCTETRPYNQGARLTAFELAHGGLPATLLCDSAAAGLLLYGGAGPADPPEATVQTGARWSGRPHAVVVGADRVAANGDTANKVGTLSLAVAAARAGVPFFVAAPTTTLDPALADGGCIPIEQRPADEITHAAGGGGGAPRPRVAATGVAVWNPSFDVTPAALITGGIVTEVGLVKRVVGGDGEVAFDVAAAVAAGVARRARVEAEAEAAARAARPAAAAACPAAAAAAEHTLADPFAPAPFDPAAVRAYLASRPALAERLGGSPADWTVEELSDGNLNFVFLVRGPGEARGDGGPAGAGGSLVLKQALPYIRIDRAWRLTATRCAVEAAALEEAGRLAPGAVPAVYSFDPAASALAMEWVPPPAAVVRGRLTSGHIVPGLAGDVARYLARTAFGTSLFALASPAWRALAARFPNADLCALTEQVVFDDPFHAAPANADHGAAEAACPALAAALAALKVDAPARAAAGAAKARFCEQRQALLHGDLHTGSVMGLGAPASADWATLEAEAEAGAAAGGRRPAVVIDPEFACAGPIAYDAGKFAANLLIAFLAADGRRSGDGSNAGPIGAQQAWLAASVTAFWAAFTSAFAEAWDAAAARGEGGALAPAPLVGADALAGAECLALHQAAFFADTTDAAIRFGGAVLLRRVVGIAQVADFKGLPDPAARGRAMCAALTVGRAMLVGGAAAFPGGWGDVVKSARAALEEGK